MGRGTNIIFVVPVALAVALSVWGPEALSGYQDRSLLGKIHRQETEASGEGYRYELSAAEKVYVLSQALGSVSHTEGGAAGSLVFAGEPYGEAGGDYAFITNQKNPSGENVSGEAAYAMCSRSLRELKEAGLLPESVQEADPAFYDAVLYSAIDVREPRSYVAVWKLSLSDRIRGVRKENRLMEVYMDADDGKIYEFYARTEWEWEEIDPDAIARAWCAYLGLENPSECGEVNPLAEATPYFKKYVVPGGPEERTVMTVGFYEGIREFFVKVSW
ncbi:hypothetical protein D3Z51_16970 [Clostridiaceae bacterium]|nr:hypothetical protein [Clostridiaceae bacterium]RKI09070.1 hypothetical protein D7V81_18020 [bacterium 1XD21-70]